MALPRSILLPVAAAGLVILVAGVLFRGRWTDDAGDQDGSLKNERPFTPRGSAGDATASGIQGDRQLGESLTEIQRGRNLKPLDSRTASFVDVSDKSFSLINYSDTEGRTVRVSNREGAEFIGSFDIVTFLRELAEHRQGPRLLKLRPLQTSPGPELSKVVEAAGLQLYPEMEIDFFPVEIVDLEGARTEAWVLSTATDMKDSKMGDGIPAGVEVDPLLAYKRRWYVLPNRPNAKTPLYYKAFTWEE